MIPVQSMLGQVFCDQGVHDDLRGLTEPAVFVSAEDGECMVKAGERAYVLSLSLYIAAQLSGVIADDLRKHVAMASTFPPRPGVVLVVFYMASKEHAERTCGLASYDSNPGTDAN
jgi:hypothetical protein